jgi:hypothetical protein
MTELAGGAKSCIECDITNRHPGLQQHALGTFDANMPLPMRPRSVLPERLLCFCLHAAAHQLRQSLFGTVASGRTLTIGRGKELHPYTVASIVWRSTMSISTPIPSRCNQDDRIPVLGPAILRAKRS